jgi:hypothetical protein
MGYLVSVRFQMNVSYFALRFSGPGGRIMTDSKRPEARQ